MTRLVPRLFLAAALASGFLPNTNVAQSPHKTSANAEVALLVNVTGLRNDKGQVLIVLRDRAEGFPTKGNSHNEAIAVSAKKAVRGSLTASFQVVPGMYAISSLHDENGNGKMDLNLVGIPKEGYGTSSPKTGIFHIPKFDEAAFQVTPAGRSVTLHMHYQSSSVIVDRTACKMDRPAKRYRES